MVPVAAGTAVEGVKAKALESCGLLSLAGSTAGTVASGSVEGISTTVCWEGAGAEGGGGGGGGGGAGSASSTKFSLKTRSSLFYQTHNVYFKQHTRNATFFAPDILHN